MGNLWILSTFEPSILFVWWFSDYMKLWSLGLASASQKRLEMDDPDTWFVTAGTTVCLRFDLCLLPTCANHPWPFFLNPVNNMAFEPACKPCQLIMSFLSTDFFQILGPNDPCVLLEKFLSLFRQISGILSESAMAMLWVLSLLSLVVTLEAAENDKWNKWSVVKGILEAYFPIPDPLW